MVGANGGIVGMDMLPMDKPHFTDRTVHITGVGNHLINDKRIGRYCAVSPSSQGDTLCIYNEYARVTKQPTSIHSVTQLRDYKSQVHDCSTLLGGRQCIVSVCGRVFPLAINKGLPYLPQ